MQKHTYEGIIKQKKSAQYTNIATLKISGVGVKRLKDWAYYTNACMTMLAMQRWLLHVTDECIYGCLDVTDKSVTVDECSCTYQRRHQSTQ